MQGNASWLSGFLFSISCFQGWSLWTELLCSTSLGSVQCQCSGTRVSLSSRHRKSMASPEQNVSLLSTRAPAAPSMDFPRWNPSCCVCCCTVLSSEPWMCASSASLTQQLLWIACISVGIPAPLRAAELQPCPWRKALLLLPCSVCAHGTAFSMNTSCTWASSSLPSQPPPTSLHPEAAALDRSQVFE